MASPALFETMSRQVEAECSEHLATARAEAERILADARAKARATGEAALASAKAERDRLDALWKQKGDAEAVRLELSMKNDAVEAVLAEVAAGIKRFASGPEFPAALERLLEELMAAAGSGTNVRVLGPSAQVDRIKTWLAGHGYAGVPVEGSPEFWDGVAVQDPGRNWRVSNTLSGRSSRVDQAARKHCMSTLFASKGVA